jgi:hypothetical protein
MLLPLMLPLAFNVLAAPAPKPATSGPADAPIKVWLSSKGDYKYGDKAKAYVQAAEDGYIVVLHVEPTGHVRVLFPVEPNDDQFMRGGKKYELRSRGDREAFIAADSGSGVVFVAFSKSRFAVEKFTENGHWDYRALTGDLNNDGDVEARLMDIVQEMQPAVHYAYDAANYRIAAPYYAADHGDHGHYGYSAGPHVGVGLMLGIPHFGPGYGYGMYGYNPFYSPFPRYGAGAYNSFSWGGIRSWGRG